MVYQRHWSDNVNDMDRQRRKQAEFLIHQSCPWTLIQEIGVLSSPAKTRVEQILNDPSCFSIALRSLTRLSSHYANL
jgi:hypothetical protein